MKIVIEIDDDDYQFIKDTEFENYEVTKHLYEAVDDGTPLPEHHGRLIDLNDLYDFDRRKVEYAPTIIEGSESK